jgi:hypothetical protein
LNGKHYGLFEKPVLPVDGILVSLPVLSFIDPLREYRFTGISQDIPLAFITAVEGGNTFGLFRSYRDPDDLFYFRKPDGLGQLDESGTPVAKGIITLF